MHDLLTEDLIHVRVDDVARAASLPQVLAWLSGEHEVVFPGLRPHQRHPWFAFLVQLGAIARARGGLDRLSCEPAAWRAALLMLTGGRSEPWSLVVSDLSMPALLQPPVPEASLDGFKTTIAAPDQLDILLTTRNFDLKGQRMNTPLPEHWLYALVTKQTFEGYSGKANYGIVRMNGGQSNRPCVSMAPSLSWAARFQRDVQVWLDHRAEPRCSAICDRRPSPSTASSRGGSDPLKPPPTGGLTWSSIHGPVGPVRGFGSVYDQPHEPSGLR